MLTRTQANAIAIALLVIGGIALVFALVYSTIRAGDLPTFFPGHVSVPTHALRNGRVIHTHTDTKRALVLLLVGAALLGGAWYVRFGYEPVD
ncbi:MAG TPA: hypothetical protein VEP49_02425 [Acidimicrobiia bacterium]|nr:hypothetical protein [Acidimicrobiia bacterium]